MELWPQGKGTEEMPSQFFGLNIAYTGLLASNAALNTTSNNIANVQTEGYSRQKVNQQAAQALRIFQSYGCAGAGVETLSVERIRDEFYDHRYWRNNAKVGEYDQKQYYMQQIETYFDDNGKNAGFKTVFNQFMITGLQELMKNPDSADGKSQFVGNAGALLEYFNGLAGNLEKVQDDVNEGIKQKIDEINSLAGEIATLNKQINTIELTGVKANELRDRRALLLDQLSQVVDVEVKETPIVDTNNPDRETGGNHFVVKIAGGQVLVDDNEYNRLECVARKSNEKVNQTDIDGLYDVYWENGEEFNLYNASMGGALKGLVELRDGNNGENFNGIVSEIGQNAVGAQTVTIQVGKSYLMDLNKCNLSDQGGKITLWNQEFYYDSWEYTISYDDNGEAVYSYTFALSQEKELNPWPVTNDKVGKSASIGEDISYQGVPYYMQQMNEWLRTFSQKFNDILKQGYGTNSEPGIHMFTADWATDDKQYEFPSDYRYDTFTYEVYQERVKKRTDELLNANPGMTQAEAEAQAKKESAFTVGDDDDSYYQMTAKNASIVDAMEKDPGLLATRYDKADGVEQNDLLEDLKRLATDKEKMSYRGCSASEFLQCILSDVALNTNRANIFYKSFSDISGTIDMQRISISGVDEDEEAVNLVKYQNGYNLASRMIQTLTEIYDRLILQTGV